ncbi:hypothetical protein [Aerococcus urinaeequi]|uniref:hypothetical protein n=1 Tax=Aerococcus urinaeequi TaxID=51665 RepID=UPI003B3AF06D
MELNDFLSTIATLISISALYLSYKNTQEQQKLEKEMQRNEFSFSRKKVWFEKQNEILDKAIEKLMENYSIINLLDYNFKKQDHMYNQRENEVLEELNKFDKNKLMEAFTTGNEEKIFDELDQIFEEKNIENIKGFNTESVGEKLDIVYENFVYLRSHEHYFSKSIKNNINSTLDLHLQILKHFSKENYSRKELENYLNTMKFNLSKMTDEIRKDFLDF